MPRDPKAAIDTLRERIEADERDLPDADRNALLGFADELALRKHETGHHRQLKLLRHCTRIGEEVGDDVLTRSLADRDAAKEAVGWIHATYDNEETNRDYRVAIRKFGRLMSDENGDDPPETMEFIGGTTGRGYNPEPNPAEMLDWENDVLAMIDTTRSARDAALFALQFDAGMRSGELENLAPTDFADSEYSLKVHVDGKLGQRSVDLIPSIPHVRRWLNDHPAPDDPDVSLWCDSQGEDLNYDSWLKIFKRAGERAEIGKPVTPTAFRKSNASWLARQGANAALIEDRQGRKRGSKYVARYVARFGGEAEAQYARMHGVEVDATDEPAEIGPLTCPRCERETPREKPLCVWCSQALSPAAAEAADDHDDAMFESVAEADNAELVEDLQKVRGLLGKHNLLESTALDVERQT